MGKNLYLLFENLIIICCEKLIFAILKTMKTSENEEKWVKINVGKCKNKFVIVKIFVIVKMQYLLLENNEDE